MITPFVIDDTSQIIVLNNDQLWIRPNPVYAKFYEHNPYTMKYGETFAQPFYSPGTRYEFILFSKQGNNDIHSAVYDCLIQAKTLCLNSVYLPLFTVGNGNFNEETITRLTINGIKQFDSENPDEPVAIYIGLLKKQITALDILRRSTIESLGAWDPKTAKLTL